jgi:acetolactate synthase-1/2/3 large subunit
MSTTADLMVESLARAGVARIFTTRWGGATSELIQAARRVDLPVVACRHESTACLMAAVTGDLTGRPGAALSSGGCGLAASAAGIAHAWLDRSPMLYLSEHSGSPTEQFARYRALDATALLSPIVKGSVTTGAASVSHAVAHAVQLALAEPRGPVHLDVAADTARQWAVPMALHVDPPPAPAPDAGALEQAAAMILAAKRPLVIAGLHCRSSDAAWLRAFCEAMPAPVLTTVKAKGAIPDPHPLSMGVWGDSALDATLVERADLLITFGLDGVEVAARRWTNGAAVLSFSRSRSSAAIGVREAGLPSTPAHEVVGDLSSILEELAPRLIGRSRADWDIAEVERLRTARRRAVAGALSGFGAHRAVQLTREFTPAGSIASADAGALSEAAAAHWQAVEPGEFLASSALGLPGFALSAAIAAQLVYPVRRVVCFTERRALLAVAAELETVARLALPIAIVVFDLDDVAPTGDREPGDRDAPNPVPTDLAGLSRAFGISAVRVAGEDAFRSALLSALAAAKSTLIDASGPASTEGRGT